MNQKYYAHIYKPRCNKSPLKLFSFTITYLILIILVNIYTIYTEAQEKISANQKSTNEEASLYSETLLGDEQTPFFLFGREILSSNDISTCSTQQDIDETLQNITEKATEQILDNIQRTLRPIQQSSTEQPHLLGFPLTALNEPLMLGGIVTGFSYSHSFPEESIYNRMFSQHNLRNLSIDTQVRLINSNEGCSLSFMPCGRDSHCITDTQGQIQPLIRIPILGISQKHQAAIIDPSEFGKQLKAMVLRTQGNPSSSLIPYLFNIQKSQSLIVDFSQSTLIFDIIKTLAFYPQNLFNFRYHFVPPPQVTSRWFIKFGLDVENNFVSRPQTEGIQYKTTRLLLYDDVFIYRQNISPDSPVHFYVKNFPDEYKETARQAFQYWNSMHISLKGYPAFSYTFIQGDYDGQKEIILGDIRYNVMEWNQNIFPSATGLTAQYADQKTGEILSTSILIRGSHIVDEVSRWFRYSEMIRANETVIDNTLTDNLISQNPFYIISRIHISTFPPHLQVHLLAPQGETVENYIFDLLKRSNAHEIGHALGFHHNFKANIFEDSDTFYSVTDYLRIGNYTNLHYTTNNYDSMALAYSYSGILPEYTDRSCSENEAINLYFSDWNEQKNKSPECSSVDATSFPLEYATNKLKDILNLLIKRKDEQSFPYLIWNQNVESFFDVFTYSIASYHFSADTQYDQLQSVLIDGRKPNSPQEVKELVIEYLTPILCDSRLSHILSDQNIPNNTFSGYLYSNATKFIERFHYNIFNFTDINTITCPNSDLTFRRDNWPSG